MKENLPECGKLTIGEGQHITRHRRGPSGHIRQLPETSPNTVLERIQYRADAFASYYPVFRKGSQDPIKVTKACIEFLNF